MESRDLNRNAFNVIDKVTGVMNEIYNHGDISEKFQ